MVGRMHIIYAEIQSHPIFLARIYAPNVADPQFFAELEGGMQHVGDCNVIIGGDFNLVMDSTLDRSHPVPSRSSECLGLADVWRTLNPQGRDYTFFSSPHSTFTRIDFF